MNHLAPILAAARSNDADQLKAIRGDLTAAVELVDLLLDQVFGQGVQAPALPAKSASVAKPKSNNGPLFTRPASRMPGEPKARMNGTAIREAIARLIFRDGPQRFRAIVQAVGASETGVSNALKHEWFEKDKAGHKTAELGGGAAWHLTTAGHQAMKGVGDE